MFNYPFFKKFSLILLFCLTFFFCKDIETEKKIDPNLKLRIKNLNETSQLDQNVSVVFKVNEKITDLHLQVLRNNKVKIIANIGHIYTASLPARKIYGLAKMKFVDYIQSSRKYKATPEDSTRAIQKM